MQIGILCAVKEEFEPYLDSLKEKAEMTHAKYTFYSGSLFDKQVVIVHCGIAKVNAAVATQILIDKFGCDFIVLSGTAGGLCPTLRIGDTVVATSVHYHDVDDHNMIDHFPHAPNAAFLTDTAFAQRAIDNRPYNIVNGAMACGEYFISGKQREEIRTKLKAVAVDMESASVGHTCFINKIPFAVVKSISDCPQNDTQKCFEENLVLASRNSFDVVGKVLSSL